MSRIGKKSIPVPAKVEINIDKGKIRVANSGKSLEMPLRPEVVVNHDSDAKEISVTLAEGVDPNIRFSRAIWGTTRANINNMIIGVTQGYEKKLEVVGVGYNASVAGPNLNLKVGFANVISVPIPTGVDVAVEKNLITVKGPDKQAVGEFAATVRAKRKPEPYNGKGIKYSDEVIRRKQGKAFGN
ncbi:MAG: 50S ribosomal protein L6 [Phycisphaerales bacterium]